ncbi:MAG: hypothetical protein JEZ00_18850 [Anaerolineaceae bacterium]|nr:hypothetical protein [Anaerolineaceae bacterium]
MQRLNRIGTFLILVGIAAIALFIVSDISRLPDFRFLLWGAIGLILGSLIKWLNPKPEKKAASRFRILRKRNEDEDL